MTGRGRPLGMMIGVGLLSWLIVAGIAGTRANPEVLYGMAGPLAVAALSWIMTERTYLSRPEPTRLIRMAVRNMAIKAVFFGTYMGVMLRVLTVRPLPFVVSFISYFLAFHLLEALFIQRLVTGGAGSSSR